MAPHAMEPAPAQPLAQPAVPPAEHAMTNMSGPAGGWGDFGPHGSPDLSGADNAAAGQIDSAGGGLSNIEARLNGLQDHIHPDEATAPSAMPSESPLAPVHQAPVLPSASAASPLSTADGVAAQGFATAGDDLGAAEHDLAGLHVHEPGESGTLDSGSSGVDSTPGLLATNPQVSSDLAQTALQQPDLAKLDELNDGLVWRQDNNMLYHGDNRGESVFTDGLPVDDIDNLGLRNHVFNHPEFDGYASTTTDPDLWQTWGSGYRYFYEIDAPGGVDVNATLGPHAYTGEQEVAMPGGVQPERIRGMWPVKRDPETGQVTRGPYVQNPNYRPRE
jgi:hypothetical protein